jgi:inosose dehydratase
MLHDAGLRAVGGFLPVVLHDASADPVPQVEAFVEAGLVAGADVVVLAAATGTNGYDHRRSLDEHEWSTLLANLDRIADATARRGAVTALHPHVGTVVERAEEVARVLRGSTVGLCVDTGTPARRGHRSGGPRTRGPGTCRARAPQGPRCRAGR